MRAASDTAGEQTRVSNAKQPMAAVQAMSDMEHLYYNESKVRLPANTLIIGSNFHPGPFADRHTARGGKAPFFSGFKVLDIMYLVWSERV